MSPKFPHFLRCENFSTSIRNLPFFVSSPMRPELLPPNKSPNVSLKEPVGSDTTTATDRLRQVQHQFHTAVCTRDDGQCVVTGERFRVSAHNVQAAHIFPLGQEGSENAARDAGLSTLNDISNGILLSSEWHAAFDKYQWCFDADGVIHLEDVIVNIATFSAFANQKIKQHTSLIGFPPRAVLAKRWEWHQQHRQNPVTAPLSTVIQLSTNQLCEKCLNNTRNLQCDHGKCRKCCMSDGGCHLRSHNVP